MATNSPIANLPVAQLGDPPNFEAAMTNLTNALDRLVVPKFPNATARNTANPTPQDGDHAYLTNTHELTVYRSHLGEWVTYGFASNTPVTQLFTSSGTWSKPADARFVHVRIVGGGGAGGGGNNGTGGINEGGGGGGGGYCESLYAANELASSVSVTIGSGGSPVLGTGGNGGNSTFGALMTASGGSGGTGAAAPEGGGSYINAGGAGGAASGGNILNARGEPGGHGRVLTGLAVLDNRGGGTLLANSTISRTSAGGGNAGQSPGGGGSGGVTNSSVSALGGSGASGICIVTTYF